MSTSSTVEPDYSDEQRDSVADAMLGMVDRSEAERQEVYNWVRRKWSLAWILLEPLFHDELFG